MECGSIAHLVERLSCTQKVVGVVHYVSQKGDKERSENKEKEQLQTQLNFIKRKVNSLSDNTKKSQLHRQLSNLENRINHLSDKNIKPLQQEIEAIKRELKGEDKPKPNPDKPDEFPKPPNDSPPPPSENPPSDNPNPEPNDNSEKKKLANLIKADLRDALTNDSRTVILPGELESADFQEILNLISQIRTLQEQKNQQKSQKVYQKLASQKGLIYWCGAGKSYYLSSKRGIHYGFRAQENGFYLTTGIENIPLKKKGDWFRKYVESGDKITITPFDDRLINKVMKDGEKRTAREIVYKTAAVVEKKTSLPFLTVFEGALTNIKPAIEMKRRRIGASKQRVPKEIGDERSSKIALRWLVEGAKERRVKGKKLPHPLFEMFENLAEEINDAYNKSGEAFKKKENLYKEAETGRIPEIIGFLNHQRKDDKLPDPVSETVVKNFLTKIKEKEIKTSNYVEVDLKIDDLVKITEGKFINQEGRIVQFDKKKQKAKIVIESSGWEISDVPVNICQKILTKKGVVKANDFQFCSPCETEVKEFQAAEVVKELNQKNLTDTECFPPNYLKPSNFTTEGARKVQEALTENIKWHSGENNELEILVHQSAKIECGEDGFLKREDNKMYLAEYFPSEQ
ncbi:4239_t:CDS:2 [Funneliformis geosporum]|nr:4239_t:CDS:2 [Funneliformis geosporum]